MDANVVVKSEVKPSEEVRNKWKKRANLPAPCATGQSGTMEKEQVYRLLLASSFTKRLT